MFQVDYYQKDDGSFPVEEFIRSLDRKMRAKVYEYLVLLMNEGNELRPPYSQLVESGIYEIRIRQSSNIIRILYFFYSGKRIILTNGFVKKTQKTPPEEIQLAKARRKRFLEREGKC